MSNMFSPVTDRFGIAAKDRFYRTFKMDSFKKSGKFQILFCPTTAKLFCEISEYNSIKRLNTRPTISSFKLNFEVAGVQLHFFTIKLLIFSRRIFFQRKLPDTYSDLFFLQTTDITLIDPLYKETTTLLRPCPAKANLIQKVPFIFYFFNVIYQIRRD